MTATTSLAGARGLRSSGAAADPPDAPRLLMEAKYETLNALRTPAIALPFIVIPVVIYLAVRRPHRRRRRRAESEFGPGIANYLFSGFSVIAAIMPGIFSGVILAQERDNGLFKLKRALPLPPGANAHREGADVDGLRRDRRDARRDRRARCRARSRSRCRRCSSSGHHADRRHDSVLRDRALHRRVLVGARPHPPTAICCSCR